MQVGSGRDACSPRLDWTAAGDWTERWHAMRCDSTASSLPIGDVMADVRVEQSGRSLAAPSQATATRSTTPVTARSEPIAPNGA